MSFNHDDCDSQDTLPPVAKDNSSQLYLTSSQSDPAPVSIMPTLAVLPAPQSGGSSKNSSPPGTPTPRAPPSVLTRVLSAAQIRTMAANRKSTPLRPHQAVAHPAVASSTNAMHVDAHPVVPASTTPNLRPVAVDSKKHSSPDKKKAAAAPTIPSPKKAHTPGIDTKGRSSFSSTPARDTTTARETSRQGKSRQSVDLSHTFGSTKR